MIELSGYEQTWIDVLDELQNCPEIEVLNEYREIDPEVEDAETSLSAVAHVTRMPLGASFRDCHFRFEYLGSAWQSAESKDHFITGEFCLQPLETTVLNQSPLELWADMTPEQERLQFELRAIDGTPEWGTGHLAALRVQPGIAEPEIWFDKTSDHYYQLELDYQGYLDALRVTKGTFGWQYLFTASPLNGGKATLDRLRTMLDLFPKWFPDHDYEPFRRRLNLAISRPWPRGARK
ncbi:hypothetical protein [Actinomadura oligospora]|uniref:hypothetical protein n=1 Tax=Actinomadura oligospora TaxID=111804 RepID=UPI000478C9FB|nr:hypothetical protein [Actinomadura oligospora]